MKIYLDIENSKTKKVKTLGLSTIKYDIKSEIVLDISNLNRSDMQLLYDACNEKKSYTDIELFFVEGDMIPNFGPDYNYFIDGEKLLLIYKKKNKNKIDEEQINIDWTYNYENEFNELAKKFIISHYCYMIIYYDDVMKAYYQENAPKKDIYINLFFEKGYKAISIYKKRDLIIPGKSRENLIYINSYCEFDDINERRV